MKAKAYLVMARVYQDNIPIRLFSKYNDASDFAFSIPRKEIAEVFQRLDFTYEDMDLTHLLVYELIEGEVTKLWLIINI